MARVAETWTAFGGGVLPSSVSTERTYFGCFTELRGALTEVNWTTDGTVDGDSLFSTSIMPWVEVQITPYGDRRDFTQNYYGGPIYTEDQRVNSYSWVTAWDSTNSIWFTTIYRRGEPDADASAEESPSATVFLHAVGDAN